MGVLWAALAAVGCGASAESGDLRSKSDRRRKPTEKGPLPVHSPVPTQPPPAGPPPTTPAVPPPATPLVPLELSARPHWCRVTESRDLDNAQLRWPGASHTYFFDDGAATICPAVVERNRLCVEGVMHRDGGAWGAAIGIQMAQGTGHQAIPFPAKRLGIAGIRFRLWIPPGEEVRVQATQVEVEDEPPLERSFGRSPFVGSTERQDDSYRFVLFEDFSMPFWVYFDQGEGRRLEPNRIHSLQFQATQGSDGQPFGFCLQELEWIDRELNPVAVDDW